MKLKNNLKLIREAKRLSREQVAQRCKISLGTYTNIEHGRSIPKLSTALLIAKVLGETVDRLFSIKEERE